MSDAAEDALDKLENDVTIRLQLSGTDEIVHDNDADYSDEDVEGMTDDDVERTYGVAGPMTRQKPRTPF